MWAREIFEAWSSFWRIFIVLIFALGVGSVAVEAKVRKNVPPPAPPVEKTESGTSMSFTVLRFSSNTCEPLCPEWIAAEGEITDQTPAKLTKLLTNTAYRKLPVILNSPGGKVDAAMIMARMIRKYDMNTGVAVSVSTDCTSLQSASNHCPADANVHSGWVLSGRGYCNSACTLMLLGGRERVAAPNVILGLHQPHGETQRWVDHYIDTWRMINGKKKIISHRFIKRTYEKPKAFAGVTPQMKPRYLKFLKEMGGSPLILDEMAKASPANLNAIPYNKIEEPREKLGLVTNNDLEVSYFVSLDRCKAQDKPPSNCILIKDYVGSTIQPSNQSCFILSGCGTAKKESAQIATKGVPCFKATGCSDADKLAAQEWLNNRGKDKVKGTTAKGTPCFAASGCSEADKIATQVWLANRNNIKNSEPANRTPCFIQSGCSKTDSPVTKGTVRNGDPDMSFALVRLDDYRCKPRCPEWIAAEGWITKETPRKFEIFLSNVANHDLPVVLQSRGGDFEAAIELGYTIHKNKMNTAVGVSSIFSCPMGADWPNNCPINEQSINKGFAGSVGAYCERACVVVLLAGEVRALNNEARVIVVPLIDEIRVPFEQYLITLRQSFGIVKEMDSARLTDGINIIPDPGNRLRAGLTTQVGLEFFTGPDHCKTYGKLSANCVEIKEKEPQTAVTP